MQVSAAHGIEQTKGVLARNTEDRFGTESFKGFDDEVPAVADAGPGVCPRGGGCCAGIEINHLENSLVSVELAPGAANPAWRRDSWPSACAA